MDDKNIPLSRDAMIAEIAAIVNRLADVQTSRKLSDRQLVDEYPDLGSTRTWRQRLVNGNLGDIKLDRMLHKLRRIGIILDGGSPDDVFFTDMPFARQLAALVTTLERQRNDRRILPVLAPNGCGKTVSAHWLVNQRRAGRTYTRCRDTWRNKPLHQCIGMAASLGHTVETTQPAEAEAALIEILKSRPTTMFIDQAHEGGVALLHLLRCLVDETPSRFVYLAYDTAFRKVQTANTDAMIEAQAFLGRCLKPIFNNYKGGVTREDTRVFLQRNAGLSLDTAASVAERVTSTLSKTQNLRLLGDAIDAARVGNEDDEATADAIVRQVYLMAGMEPGATPLTKE